MASRSTRVTIRNQTGATLRHIDDSLEHGIWTEPWRPPAEISPGSTMSWWSESDGIATGTEGHARYAVVGSDDIVTFHWDNPFVGANFYEQSVTGPFGIYFSGGTGNNAEVVYSLIPDARVSVRGYLPSTHGFAFPNHWPAEHITSITMPDPFGDILIGNAAWGLCGGMSFASRDYFESGMWAPEQATNPSGEGDPLFDYIVRRLAQSLNAGDVADFLKYADPVYPNTDDPTLGNGRDWVMAHVAFPGIRDLIDSGHPCPIGLVLKQLPSLAGLGHQVCVYAYQLTGQELVLWVYDPNSPGDDHITMFMDISRTDQALIDVKGTVNVPEHPICFFTQGYEQRDPVQPRRPASAIDVGRKSTSSSAVSWANNRLDIFGVGADGAMYHKAWDGAAWTPADGLWEPLGGKFSSPPAAVSWANNRLDIFGLGADGAMYHKAWDGAAWTPVDGLWEPLGGKFSSPPAAVSWANNRLDIFGLGADGAMYHKAWDGAAWTPADGLWEPLGGKFSSRPAAVSWANNRLDIFGVGADGAMYHKAWDGAAWTPADGLWEPLGGKFSSPPAAVSWANNRLDIFGLGTDGAMYHKAWDGAAWTPADGLWEPLGGKFSSPPAAVSWANNRLDIFGLGTDGAMYHKAWDGAAWTPADGLWESLGGKFSSPPAAVSWANNRLDIFGLGTDGAMYHKAWDGAAWTPADGLWEPLGGKFSSL